MKYLVLEVTTLNGTTAKALWEHESIDSAKAQFHSILASAYANTDITYALSQIIDERGFCIVTERKPTYTEPSE